MSTSRRRALAVALIFVSAWHGLPGASPTAHAAAPYPLDDPRDPWDPWDEVPARAFPGLPADEARWFVARIGELPAVVQARAAWVASAQAIDQALVTLAQGIDIPPVPIEVTSRSEIDKSLSRSDTLDATSVQDLLLSALYGVLERQAKREILAFVLDQIDDSLCGSHPSAPYLQSTCRLVTRDDDQRLDLDAVQVALRKDLVELPFALARRAALPAPVACAVRLIDRVRTRVSPSDAVRTVTAILDEGLALAPCTTALGITTTRPAALELALRAVRLLAAATSTGPRGPAQLVADAKAAVLDALALPAVPTPGADEVHARIDMIARYLRDGDVVDRGRWERALAQARAALDSRLAERRRALDAALATIRNAGSRFVEETPLARLAGAVLDTTWRDAPDEDATLGAARSLVRGAAALVVELFAAAQLDPDLRALVQTGLALAEHVLAGDYRAALDAALGATALADVAPLRALAPWVGLVAGLASADTSAEAEAVLGKYAAPVGTWAARRKRRVFGVSGQLGIAVHSEDLVGVGRAPAGAFGLVVPVGVDLSFPLGSGFALGVMAQILDLGAIGTARLGGQGAEIEPRVGFVQVLAPGLRAYLGLGQSPFVLTTQVDLVPSLRTRVDDDADERGATVLRFGVGLAVDLPLLTVD